MRASGKHKRPLLVLLADAGQRTVAGVLIGSFAVLVAAIIVGLIANHVSSRGIPIFPKVRAQEIVSLPLPPGVEPMTLQQAHELYRSDTYLFLDARSPEEYAAGHIPGALNLPIADFDARFPDLLDRVEAAPNLVCYCESMECSEGVELADTLRGIVSQPIYLFDRGWEAWQAAGYPADKGEEP